MNIGYLGFGTIALACARGLVADGHQIVVSRRNADNARAMADAHDNVRVADNQQVVDASDVLFIGSTAEAASEMLTPLRFRPNQIVLSFMVGLSAEQVAELVAPATFEAIVIPFPAIAQGGSPLLTYPASPVTQALYGQSNTVITLQSDADFSAFLSAQAVLSVVAKLMADSIGWLGDKTGNHGDAERFLRLLVGGSILADPIETSGAMATLVEALNTPGGLNRQLREFMADAGTYNTLDAGLTQLSDRLNNG